MRFIRPRQVLEMIGVSRSTLRRMVQEGSFPQPVRITRRNAGYVLEAVEAWMQARSQGLAWDAASAGAASSRSEPSHRGRSKPALAQHTGGGRLEGPLCSDCLRLDAGLLGCVAGGWVRRARSSRRMAALVKPDRVRRR